MKKQTKDLEKINRKRFDVAERDLRKMEREIAPFAKRSGYTRQTTSGQWRETTSALKDGSAAGSSR
jgi:hypothetical protein